MGSGENVDVAENGDVPPEAGSVVDVAVGSPGSAGGADAARDKAGKFRKGWKGGPGRPPVIHPAPLFDGDTETNALPGFKTEDVLPAAAAKDDEVPSDVDRPAARDRRVPPDIVDALENDGLTDVYLASLAGSEKGNASATKNLFALLERYRGADRAVKGAVEAVGAYAGLPQEAVEIMAELDIGLAELLNRFERGLVMEPIERVIAEAANAVRLDGPVSPRTSRWAAVLIREVTAMIERDENHGQAKQGTGQGGGEGTEQGGRAG